MRVGPPYFEKMGIKHWPDYKLLNQPFGIVLPGNIFPLDVGSVVKNLIANELQYVGIKFLKAFRQLSVGTCRISAFDLEGWPGRDDCLHMHT